ncbi:MAG: GNAT family N-acetyltransferase [Alphaproteobacteria bacterium]|nr:GNAT family N-acetyltransferase [Alphaproteobacteria bacterium]
MLTSARWRLQTSRTSSGCPTHWRPPCRADLGRSHSPHPRHLRITALDVGPDRTIRHRGHRLCPDAAQHARRGLDLHHIYVAPNWRGRGVGRALITAVEGRAKSRGCTYVTIGTD